MIGNYNNQNDVKTVSGVIVEKTNKDGKPVQYVSFTFKVGGMNYTCRVYVGDSSIYTPTSGKHQGKRCCPCRIQRWTPTSRGDSKW